MPNESASRPAGATVFDRVLGRWDAVLLMLSAMVAVDSVGAVAVGGAQALTWLAVLAVTFFVPSALATAELGTALPDEGGPFVWVREAFGRDAAALTSLAYWAGTPLWIGGSISAVAVAALDRLVVPMTTTVQLLVGAVFVVACCAAGLLPLRTAKWLPSSGAVVQTLLLLAFTGTVALYGLRHGAHGVLDSGLRPTTAGLVAVVPVLLYAFVGTELPSTAGEELVDPARDVPAAIARAGVAQILSFAVPVVAVLAVLPLERVRSMSGLVDAVSVAFSVYGGEVGPDGTVRLAGAGAVLAAGCALALVWVLAASGTSWVIGTSRTQAAACRDGCGPPALGVLAGGGHVPVRLVVVTGGVALGVFVAGFAATGGDGERYFVAGLTGALSLELLSFLLVFPALLRLRRSAPALHRPFRVPGGPAGAWAVTVLATGWTVLGVGCALWPGVGTTVPDALLPAGFGGDRALFEVLVLAPPAGVVVAYAGWRLLRATAAPRAGRPWRRLRAQVPVPRPAPLLGSARDGSLRDRSGRSGRMAGEGTARHVVLDLRADPAAADAAPPSGSGHDVVRVRDEGSAVDAVRRAASGRAVMVLLDAPADVGDRVLRDLRRLGGVAAVHRTAVGAAGPAVDVPVALPADCLALLELLATGLPLGEAAARLHLARRTADRRLALARRTLGVATTAEAVLRVVARSRAGRGAAG